MFLAYLLLPLFAQAPAPGLAAGPDKVELKVLYAGRAESGRSDRFAEYLSKHFTEVGRADFSAFTPSQADGYDVVILDCEIQPTPGRIGLAQPPRLPSNYDRATVVIGGAVMAVESTVKPKMDWL